MAIYKKTHQETIVHNWAWVPDWMELIRYLYYWFHLWRSLSLSTSRSLSCWAWASFRWNWACSSERSCSADLVTVDRRSISSSYSCRARVSLWAVDSSSSLTRLLNLHGNTCVLDTHPPYERRKQVLHIYTFGCKTLLVHVLHEFYVLFMPLLDAL